MKNNFKFTIFVLSILVFASCSNDSNQSSAPLNSIANTIKKITETTYSTTPSSYSIEFEYQNGNLKRIFSGTNSAEYQYNGNKITSVDYYQNSVLNNSQAITYSGDFLTMIQINPNERIRLDYSGNNLYTSTYESLINNSWGTANIESFTFDNSGNQTERFFSYTYQGSVQSFKSSYVYDNKNNPFKMMNPYLKYLLEPNSFINKSQNNVTQSYSYPDVSSTTATLSENYEIVYNSNNYPTNIKCRRAVNNELKSEITIEYN